MTTTEYHKIDTIYKRGARGHIIEREYSRPEFEYLADNEWMWTEKVDGTNIRLIYNPYADPSVDPVQIRGRTDNAQLPPHLLAKLTALTRAMPLSSIFAPTIDSTSIVLYGEGYGAKIQKGGGKYIPDGCDFVLFDIRIGKVWLRRDSVEDIAGHLGLDVVPILGSGTLRDAAELARKGFPSERWPDVDLAEGIVLRPAVDLVDRMGHRIITKIKHRDFKE